MTWQLLKSKLYVDAQEWYCGWCDEVTPIEKNPEWDGSFEGKNKRPDWFVRCGQCKEKHFQPTEFDCPECGWSLADEDTAIAYGEPQVNNAVSMNFGGKPENWEETHKCSKCGTIFTFMNCNY